MTLHPFDRRLLRVWLWVVGLAAAGELFVLSLWVVPVVQLVVIPFLPLPTVVLYLTPALAAYVPSVALLRHVRGQEPSRGTRGALLALMLAVMLLIGGVASLVLNAREPALPPVAGAAEPVTLAPVERVAMVAITDHFRPLAPNCDALCVALLVSGMAQEVDVANVDNGALAVPWPVAGGRFRLVDEPAGCAADASTWPDWARNRSSLEELRRTGGFETLFVEHFRRCITGAPAAVGEADLRLVSAVPLHPSQRRLGIEWSAPVAEVSFDRRVERGDGTVLAQWRAETVYRYLMPLLLDPVSGSSVSRRGPTQWARSAVRGPGEGADAPLDWWTALRNADELHQRANALDGLAR